MLYTPSPPTGASGANRADIFAEIAEHSQIIPVANATAEAQLVTDLTTAGKAPSATNVLYTDRTDLGEVRRNDGTGFKPITGADSGWLDPTSWGLSYNTNSTFKTRKIGGLVVWKGRFMPPSGFITTGTTSPVAVLPSGHYDNSSDRYYAATSWVAGATPPYRADGVVQVSTSGNVYLHVQANTTAVYVDGETHRVD